jgi:hypothetical protein
MTRKLRQSSELLNKLTQLINTNKLTLEGNTIKSKDFSITINQNNNVATNTNNKLNYYNTFK